MPPIRHPPIRAGLLAAALVLRFALVAVPLLLLRAALSPRPRSLSDFTDRELDDIGLSRSDVERPHARPGAAELALRRGPDGRGRR